MNFSKAAKDNLSQILAITEKNFRLRLRVRISLFFSFVSPIIMIIMPLIIMGKFFEYNDNFGPWTEANFLIFPFLAYNIALLKSIIKVFPTNLRQEKYWQTLQCLIIAPFNRFNLLFGMFLSQVLIVSIPFFIFIIICYFIYPISFFTLFFVLFLFLLIALIFSGIGIIMGIFAISHEEMWAILSFLLTLVFWASCLTYPFDIYPDFLQFLIRLNPFYYMFDVVRLTWIENNILLTLQLYPFNFAIIFSCAIILPILGVIVFNYIYKKYGIVGY